MPIKQLFSDRVVMICGNCSGEATHNLSGLAMGIKLSEDIKNLSVISIPECGSCGSKEDLLRNFVSWPGEIGSKRHRHFKAVNWMAIEMKTQGYINPDLSAEFAAETEVPEETLTGDDVPNTETSFDP